MPVLATDVFCVPTPEFADAVATIVAVPEAPDIHCARPLELMVAIFAELASTKDHCPEYGNINVT